MAQTIWTEEAVVETINSSSEVACNALLKLYARQTADEQETEHTNHHNGVGFSGADAEILTSFAKQVAHNKQMREAGTFRYKTLLSAKQLELLRKKLYRYRRQLTEIANGKEVEAAPAAPEFPEEDPRTVTLEQMAIAWEQQMELQALIEC